MPASSESAAESPPPEPLSAESLADFYERHYSYYFRQAQSMVGAPDIAHEIVQEAFTVTAEKIRDGVEIRHPGGWLRTVVRNQCTHHWRKSNRESAEPLPENDVGLARVDAPPAVARARQTCRDVFEAADELPRAQKSAFLMAEVSGLNYHEIAARLGRSEHGVRQLLARARRHVRDSVGPDPSLAATPFGPIAAPLERFAAAADGRPRGRAGAIRDYFATKLAHVQNQLQAVTRHSADLAGEPATALVVAILALGVTGGSSVGVPEPRNQPLAPLAVPGLAGGGPDGRGLAPVARDGRPLPAALGENPTDVVRVPGKPVASPVAAPNDPPVASDPVRDAGKATSRSPEPAPAEGPGGGPGEPGGAGGSGGSHGHARPQSKPWDDDADMSISADAGPDLDPRPVRPDLLGDLLELPASIAGGGDEDLSTGSGPAEDGTAGGDPEADSGADQEADQGTDLGTDPGTEPKPSPGSQSPRPDCHVVSVHRFAATGDC